MLWMSARRLRWCGFTVYVLIMELPLGQDESSEGQGCAMQSCAGRFLCTEYFLVLGGQLHGGCFVDRRHSGTFCICVLPPGQWSLSLSHILVSLRVRYRCKCPDCIALLSSSKTCGVFIRVISLPLLSKNSKRFPAHFHSRLTCALDSYDYPVSFLFLPERVEAWSTLVYE